ncbi:uncharacterized protein HMPREF1541_09628 [Cyphellophora europaea CBS 101466]|uniref:Mediator complex subunit 15 KIX domain-containing protein n=1 Tax=Cyphellophora europaea (strain CBS 101466) TaxID=1220924 RepID=W2SAY9_CYPE1|nr:uncharacterized protein HMPREF1541_09628 [Cyphellophora europaea CBS 101466]ETN45795.1 hypothetical protein HMPREF1541_09628 [Cyphellophora europaea CBS 101466]
MNPQFPNMNAMGRGMPNNMQMNQMNPAFMNPQMANAMRGQQGMGVQGGMQAQMGMGNAQIHRQIFQNLQSQGPFSGWQATVPMPERANQIRQLVDSLRLVRPPVEPPRAADVAIQFERKAFAQSATKEDYIRECHEKLTRIRDQRVQQMNVNNSVGTNNGSMAGMQGGMPMQNQAMMQQMGQNMTVNQGMGMGTPQQQMQQNMFNQQRPQNMQQNNVMANQGNNAQSNTAQSNTGHKAPEGLSQEDNQTINQRAAELAKSTPKDKMRSIIESMDARLRAGLEAKGVDPIIYYFRMMATREFRRQKDAQMMSQSGQQNQNMQGQTSFSDMGRFQSQQNEALRSQQEGDMVVPASNNQGTIPDHIRLQQQMMANTQRMNQQGPNQAMLERQRQMQIQANKMQQASQIRQQQQGVNQGLAPNQTPQQANAGFNMLNRPVGNNVQDPSPQNSRPPSRVPQQPGMQPGGPQMSLQDQQKREQALAQFPPQLQNILRQKPHTEWGNIIRSFQQNMKRSVSQQAAMNQQQPNQGMGTQSMSGPPSMQQSLSTGGMAQSDMGSNMQGVPQNQAQMNQEMMRQRAMQQQQQQRMQGDQGKQQPQVQPLGPNEMQIMDRAPVPNAILQPIRTSSRAPLPNVQGPFTWIMLKQWAQANPIPGIPMPQLMKWQATQYHTHRNKQQQAQMQQGQPQMMQRPMNQQQPQQSQNQPQPQQQQQQQQMGAPGQQIGGITIPTPADIQRVRAQNPRLQGMSDEDVRRALINKQRQNQQAQINMARQGMHQGQGVQGQPQPMHQSQMTQMQQTQQQSKPPQQQQQSQPPQPQPPRPQSQQAQARPNQQQPVKTPNQSIEGPKAPSAQQQPQQPQAGPPGQVTREQYEAMSPQQKQNWIRMQQRQAIAKKIVVLTGQVQQGLANLPPPNLDDAGRQRLSLKLSADNVKQMLGRIDSFLVAYYDMTKDEAELRKLVEFRTLLFRQYQQKSVQEKTFIPSGNFTINNEKAEEMIAELSAKFQQTAASIPRQGVQGHQLTPENLKQLEAQEQERKKSVGNKSRDVPPAPTSSQPPFSFGGERGHGAPTYAQPGIKQEDLKLPADPKRRKKNPPATPSTTTKTPTGPTPTPPQAKAAPPAPAAKFKCVFNCERQVKGFQTQAELEHHIATAHGMEQVSDPLAFLDASLREAFNLDENMCQIMKLQPQSQPMVKTASNLKTESRVGTPSAMARIPSQSGPMTSAAIKSAQAQQDEEDMWQYSNIKPAQLDDIFGDMEWESVVPATTLELQDQILAKFRETDAWKAQLKQPAETPETNRSKSASPPTAKDAEPKTEEKPEDDFTVDMSGIDGLDLTGLEEYETLGISDSSSPFEMVEKPGDADTKMADGEPPEYDFLRKHGIEPTLPYEQLDENQRQLYDFIMEPMPDDTVQWIDDGDWADLTARPRVTYHSIYP